MNSLTIRAQQPDLSHPQQLLQRGLGRAMDLLERLERYADRRRQRRALLALDDRLLDDIGISRSEALHEGTKPFWRG